MYRTLRSVYFQFGFYSASFLDRVLIRTEPSLYSSFNWNFPFPFVHFIHLHLAALSAYLGFGPHHLKLRVRLGFKGEGMLPTDW